MNQVPLTIYSSDVKSMANLRPRRIVQALTAPGLGSLPRRQPRVPVPQPAILEEKPEEELPEGTPLLSVAGEELPKSAVGPALEFLEFCSAFSKVRL